MLALGALLSPRWQLVFGVLGILRDVSKPGNSRGGKNQGETFRRTICGGLGGFVLPADSRCREVTALARGLTSAVSTD